MAEGLRGAWEAEFSSWRAALDNVFEQIDRVPLNILVWGPGQDSSGFDKRRSIYQHLANASRYNSVATSEELMESDARFAGMHLYEAELIQWVAADVVIVLIARGPTGSQAETAIYRGEQQFRDKAWLVVPKLSAKERRKVSFLEHGWVYFPKSANSATRRSSSGTAPRFATSAAASWMRSGEDVPSTHCGALTEVVERLGRDVFRGSTLIRSRRRPRGGGGRWGSHARATSTG